MDTVLAAAKVCRHCGRRRANRPRGLCWSDYQRPEVRDLYGPVSGAGRRGAGEDFAGGHGPPPAPTAALPGSPQKVAVLAERVTLRCRLFDPRDAAWAD